MHKKLNGIALLLCTLSVSYLGLATPVAALASQGSVETSDVVLTPHGYSNCLLTHGPGAQATLSNMRCNDFTIRENNGLYTINNEYGNCLYVNASNEVTTVSGLCSFSNSHEAWQETKDKDNAAQFKNQFSHTLLMTFGTKNGDKVWVGTAHYNKWDIDKV